MIPLNRPSFGVEIFDRTLDRIPALIVENDYDQRQTLSQEMAGRGSGEMIRSISHTDNGNAVRAGELDSESGAEAPAQATRHGGAEKGPGFIEGNLMGSKVVLIENHGLFLPYLPDATGQPLHINRTIVLAFFSG